MKHLLERSVNTLVEARRYAVRILPAALLSLGALAPSAIAQSRRFALPDLGRIVRIADPQLSPDGKSIAVIVSRANYAQNRYDASLVIVDVESGAQRTVLTERQGLASPRWSPNGDRIAFLSTAPSTPAQLFTMLPSGMENVPGLLTRGAALFRELTEGLEAAGYVISYGVLDLADFGVPQFRKRLVLMAGHGFEIPLPRPTHRGPERWRTVRDTIGGLLSPPTRREVRLGISRASLSWHVSRNVAEIVRARLTHVAAHGGGCQSLPESLRLDCHRRRSEAPAAPSARTAQCYAVQSLDV